MPDRMAQPGDQRDPIRCPQSAVHFVQPVGRRERGGQFRRQQPANGVAQCRKAGGKVKCPRFGKPRKREDPLHSLPKICRGLAGGQACCQRAAISRPPGGYGCKPAVNPHSSASFRALTPAFFSGSASVSCMNREALDADASMMSIADPTAWNRFLVEFDTLGVFNPCRDRRAIRSPLFEISNGCPGSRGPVGISLS